MTGGELLGYFGVLLAFVLWSMAGTPSLDTLEQRGWNRNLASAFMALAGVGLIWLCYGVFFVGAHLLVRLLR